MGSKPSMLKSGRHEPEFYEAMWQELTVNGSWRGEIWNRRKNGEIYPEWLTITAIRDVTPIAHNGCRPPKRRRV